MFEVFMEAILRLICHKRSKNISVRDGTPFPSTKFWWGTVLKFLGGTNFLMKGKMYLWMSWCSLKLLPVGLEVFMVPGYLTMPKCTAYYSREVIWVCSCLWVSLIWIFFHPHLLQEMKRRETKMVLIWKLWKVYLSWCNALWVNILVYL